MFAAPADTLGASIVTADRGVTVSRTDTVKIERMGAMQNVGDVLLLTPGLLLNDNGGLAGLKTVSLRGFGSPHTSICIDGIKVGNVQSGQADLGMLGLEDFSGAVVDYAQNSINFTTRRPVFGDRSSAGCAGVDCGSFGTWQPRARLDFKLPRGASLSAHGAGVFSRGDFSYGDGLTRSNNDLAQYKAGIDLFGVAGGGDWIVKTFFNSAERGAPGSEDWPSTDRQNDRNMLIQGILRQRLNARNEVNLSAKASSDRIEYLSEWGDSDGTQTEFQLNASHRLKAGDHFDLSASAGVVRDLLHSTLYEASRIAVTGIAGAELRLGSFRADATLQYDGTFDDAEGDGAGNLSRNTLCPSLDLRQTLCRGLDITGFARRACRVPTFNELYYPGYGNPALAPEDAWLCDIGVDWRSRPGRMLTFRAKADAFYNRLVDKITSAPSPDNPAVWMPYNIDEVCAAGLDADAAVDYASGEWKASLGARYSFQSADNVPYISKHSAVVNADVRVRGWGADAVWNLRAARRDSVGEMPDWNTLDLHLVRTFNLRGVGTAAVRIACRNIADSRYCLVTGYPMPGRSITAGLSVTF